MAGERRVDRRRVEGRLDDGLDQGLLVGEDPEDRALGDAGGLGDLAGGDRRPVGQEQGEGGGDDRGPRARAAGRAAARGRGASGSSSGSARVVVGGDVHSGHHR